MKGLEDGSLCKPSQNPLLDGARALARHRPGQTLVYVEACLVVTLFTVKRSRDFVVLCLCGVMNHK